jgi:glutamate-1-semialdehyde 2,1-aminomutase
MANRGIWDAVAAAGPQASIAHSESDIEAYVVAAGEFLIATVARNSAMVT